MKPRHLLLIASLAAFTISAVSATGAFAGERYATPPPVVLSPDLTAPWILQLQTPPSIRRQQYISQPVPVYRNKERRIVSAKPSLPTIRSGQRVTSPQRAATQNIAYTEGSFIRQGIATPPARQKKTDKPNHQNGLNPIFLPQEVSYKTSHKSGTIVIDTKSKFLYLVGENGMARRYGVGVGKQGFSWKGSETVSRKAEWPSWHPPKEMIARERKKGKILPVKMEGGIANPLGARALYLGNTLYRIHGTNAPSTIGKAVSSGCIRMRNQDVEELYANVPVGTKVVVQ